MSADDLYGVIKLPPEFVRECDESERRAREEGAAWGRAHRQFLIDEGLLGEDEECPVPRISLGWAGR